MKKLIDKEISSNKTKHRAPSVVARLMGMDTLPSEGKPPIHFNDCRKENSRNYLPRNNDTEENSSHHKQLGMMSFKQKKQDLSVYGIKQDATGYSKGPRPAKPHRREHPQEEVLQKFKKEFEAWQAAKVWECSRAVGLDDSNLKGLNSQTTSVENLGKHKKAMYADVERNSYHRKSGESSTSSTAVLGTKPQRSGSHHERYASKEGLSSLMKTKNSKNRKNFNYLAQYPELKCNEKQDRSSSPTRIVILKPSTERTDDIEESWPCASRILEEEGSMEYFLEEVRDRLRFEMQGKVRNKTRTSECLGEIPFSEKLTDPKQIAQHIAKQIRESVTKDLGATLMRSESTRSYRSESQQNGPDSPEFMNRNTRKLLCERLRNVLRNEADIGCNTVANGKLKPSTIVNERARLRQLTDSSKIGRRSFSEDMKDVTERTTLSFREEQVDNEGCSGGDTSPRNLVRSLSAPVSGTAFGKLLLEDQNVLTGVHIRRKHESIENASEELRKTRKDVFNIKGRVSNLRHNLTLRGKFFGRKMQSADELGGNTLDSIKAISTSPSVVLNLGIVQENSTEVPPSPASVSSSSYDELCKPSHPSPVSPLEMPITEDHPSLQISGEINCNLPDMRSQSEPTGVAGFEDISNGEEVYTARDMKCYEEAYLRNILTSSGLYDKPFDKIFAHFNISAKPIAESVFEEVENAYTKCEKMSDGVCLSQTVVCRKILFDLLNEKLLHVLTLPISSSILKRSLGCTQVPHGKKLLDNVWRQLEVHLHPPMDESGSLDSLVAYDLSMATWSLMLHENIDLVGGEVGSLILSELIDELADDMWC
uniref:Ankyrin and armadillo repeat-containing protein n=1 Tax=Anthurium amnicola TaxID=1678845 RepID=A0A1D1Z9W3_9ARAE